MSLRYACPLALGILVILASALRADGQIPTAADFAACNDEAPSAIKAGTASPVAADRVRAERARAGVPTPDTVAGADNLIQSSDPQINGMSTAGAKDAAYQAAYRTCMRRKGF